MASEVDVALYRRPQWVKDAVFYQIFPDRFAQAQRLDKPDNLRSWHAARHSRVTMAATCWESWNTSTT